MAESAGVSTTTQTLDSPKTSNSDTDDELFHYVRKSKIVESAVTGATVEALCGAVFPVTKDHKPGATVCPKCKEIYEAMSD